MLILCDFAEIINGKLYMQGGGIDRVVADAPVQFCLALLLPIGWNETNRQHEIEISLETEDGQPFPPMVDDDGTMGGLRFGGKLEVGRPPGSKAGTTFIARLAVRLPVIGFPEGGYVWKLDVNGVETERMPLVAVKGEGVGI
jgi:hypothetical protein